MCRSAGKWRMAMVLAGRLQWSVDRQQALAAELAEQLSIGGQGSEAAQLLVQYLKDIDGAVLHLIQVGRLCNARHQHPYACRSLVNVTMHLRRLLPWFAGKRVAPGIADVLCPQSTRPSGHPGDSCSGCCSSFADG